ncbi:MAG: beta-phosphoglucomutase family hydrolase [Patescibacteria group bacterium]|jgi:beta-phosphoglucomutase
MLKAIIFDMDGVITDTVPHHFSAWKKFFKQEGVNLTRRDYDKKVNGVPRIDGITNILGKVSKKRLDEMMERKQAFFIEAVNAHPPKTFSGFREFVSKLKRKKIKIAAASSSKNTEFILKKIKIYDCFDKVITGYDFKKSKPNPEIFLTAAKRIKVDPKDCVVFEDAVLGVEAGKKAKMKVVGFASSNIKDVKKADLIIKSFEKLKVKDIEKLF